MAAAVLAAVKTTASAASMAVAAVDTSLVLEETVEVGPLVGAALVDVPCLVAWLFVEQCPPETGQTQVSFASNHYATNSHPWINASGI